MNPLRSNANIGSHLANKGHVMISWPGSLISSVGQLGGPFLPRNGHSSFMVIACLLSCLVFWLHWNLGMKTGKPLASFWMTPQSKKVMIVYRFL